MARIKQPPSRRQGATKRPKSQYTNKASRKALVADEPPAVNENGDAAPKKRKAKSGKRALQEMRYLQRTTHLLIPKLSFQRLVREIAQDYMEDVRFEEGALHALQSGTEAYVTDISRNLIAVCVHAGRKQPDVEDLKFVLKHMPATTPYQSEQGIRFHEAVEHVPYSTKHHKKAAEGTPDEKKPKKRKVTIKPLAPTASDAPTEIVEMDAEPPTKPDAEAPVSDASPGDDAVFI